MIKKLLAGALFLAAVCGAAFGWDAPGHRTITRLALDGLSRRTELPEFLRDPEIQNRIADQATTPDRWRSTRVLQLANENNPDHYLDLEDLEPYGLKLEDISPLRYDFVAQLVRARDKAGDGFKGKPVNPAMDPAHVQEWPGFLPHAIMEHWAKLQASFRTMRILEALNDPARKDQVATARLNVMYHMGILAHFVGDMGQPLHTTTHHHGWVGPNPDGYATERSIHGYIDGDIVRLHAISYDSIRDQLQFDQPLIDPSDPWADVLSAFVRSHEQVVPLYQLKKSGELEGMAGKRFITARFADAAQTLCALYAAAYDQSTPTARQIHDFADWDALEGAAPPPAEDAAAGAPKQVEPAAPAAPGKQESSPKQAAGPKGADPSRFELVLKHG